MPGRCLLPPNLSLTPGLWPVGFCRDNGRKLHGHPHMLRHATGYKLANDGQDTRALQHYLGHKNIKHTVRYTELSPERFKNFWED